MNLKNLNQVTRVAFDILKGQYPTFIYRNKFNFMEIPCFCFHEAILEEIEPMFLYLQHNNYRTLSLIEFEKAVTGELEIPEKSVFITFDDGLRSI